MEDSVVRALKEAINRYASKESETSRELETQLRDLGQNQALGSDQIFKTFVEAQCGGKNALHKAAKLGHQQLFVCLEKCLQPEQRRDLYRMYDETNQEYPLQCAVKAGYMKIVWIIANTASGVSHYDIEYFLRSSNIHGHTPFHSAASNGDNAMMKLLLRHLRFDEKFAVLHQQDDDGNTPLHLAAKSKRLDRDMRGITKRQEEAERLDELKDLEDELYPDRHPEGRPCEEPAEETTNHHLLSTILGDLTPQVQSELLSNRNFEKRSPMDVARDHRRQYTYEKLKEFGHSSAWHSWWRGINHKEKDSLQQRDANDQRFSEIEGKIDRCDEAQDELVKRLTNCENENQQLKTENNRLCEQIRCIETAHHRQEQKNTLLVANTIAHVHNIAEVDKRLDGLEANQRQANEKNRLKFEAVMGTIRAQGDNITNTDETVEEMSHIVTRHSELHNETDIRVHNLESQQDDETLITQDIQLLLRKRECSEELPCTAAAAKSCRQAPLPHKDGA